METTELSLPAELPYPVVISSLELRPPAEVTRGARLLTYSFTYVSHASGSSETRFGTWDSPIEGTLDSWKIKPGDTISQTRARQPVVLVSEPCKHGMQVGGLCGLCGKDMTDFDYTGFSNASRAHIQMTHSATGPTVSLEEAQRFERETAAHLLKSRKLSLIVDLDQTIVHATVDPTVGEWIAEGEAWDTKREEGADAAEDVNPNWEALKDVKKFRLGTEGVAPRTPSQWHKGKERLDAEGCMYYIKPRPGLQDFLRRMCDKYEMHVYTMGTRAYAEAVCAAIDPDDTIFRGRLLSRDESGSLTQKSLQRLFPCDTSMVVIIDDRADVWEWSPNLLKVRPYDFFVGIGDINSTFLPKAPSLVPTASPGRPQSDPAPGASTPAAPSPSAPSAAKEAEAVAEADAAFASQNQMTIERIAAEVEERPLAKKQEELLEGGAKAQAEEAEADAKAEVNGVSRGDGETKPEKAAPNKALLKNDDTELTRVSSLLDEVHKRFFDSYDARLPDPHSKKRKMSLRGGRPADPAVPYDVKTIIPRIRAETLAGVHILFSSVIPLDVDPPSSEIWRTAEVFGATCHTSLSNQTTHVVAAKRGTAKVDAARRRGGIHVVWLAWFLDTLALWRRQDETPYLIDAEPSTGTSTSTPKQTFPDPEEGFADEGDGEELITPDADIWADANAEVDAALEETDDEDGVASQVDGDEDGDGGWRTDVSGSSGAAPPSANARGKKRARSSSVSDSGRSSSSRRSGSHERGSARVDEVQSPLAKRKKLSAARRGSSRLKVGLSAEDLPEDGDEDREGSDGDGEGDVDGDGEGDAESEGREREEQESVASTDGNGVDDDDEDDFLAREMVEEWG